MLRSLVIAAAAAAASAQPYWWKYTGYDAPNMDIKHIAGATVQDLEYACGNLTGCVAFNTDGWLKNSTTNMQPGQPCDLYVKNSSPQPAPPVYSGPMLWPIPVNITSSNTTVYVASPFTFSATNPSADLTNAFARFTAQIFKHAVPAAEDSPVADVIAKLRANGAASVAASAAAAAAAATMSTLTVTVANTNVPLQLGVDESYTLIIPADGSAATLTAATVYGAYMGLQTFSQLVVWNASLKQYTVPTAPVTISDAPRFAWRGVLIDTDRHWQSLPHIFRVIDSIVMTKMNTLHWHIVDWQSWPMESAAYPNVWQASWSELERYTFEDVAAVVEYARQRGVRVVPEFDTPGHAGSLCTGYPEVCPSPTCTMPLNPASPDTLPLINGILKELVALTPDSFFHLGGDEVDTSCWTNTPAIVDWMNAHNLTADQTYEYFVANVDQMALDLNRIPVRWEEVWKHFGTQLDPRTIIHVWLSSATIVNVTNSGYRAVWSVDGLYYLDDLSEVASSFYNVDILGGITNVTAQQLVMGGEVEMWGETVDGSEIESTIWPRAAAAAERWWSYDVTGNDFGASGVAERFSWFRCQMLDNGVASAPVNNANARTGPPGPGSCFTQ